MKTSHLHDLWAGPDNTRLTKQQFSFRLPVHVAAKLAALCDLYPTKNRTQIVADLLTAAIDDLEQHLPQGAGEAIDKADTWFAEQIGCAVGETIYKLGGPRGQFRDAANAYYRDMEVELGNENPEPLYTTSCITESDLKKK